MPAKVSSSPDTSWLDGSKSAQLVGRCIASIATKLRITIAGKVLSHMGVHPLPGFVEETHGHSTVYGAGLGALFVCCSLVVTVLFNICRIGDAVVSGRRETGPNVDSAPTCVTFMQ